MLLYLNSVAEARIVAEYAVGQSVGNERDGAVELPRSRCCATIRSATLARSARPSVLMRGCSMSRRPAAARRCALVHRQPRRGEGNATVIVTHRAEIADQISAALTAFGVPHGRIQPGYPETPDAMVQVAMVVTLGRGIALCLSLRCW